jgi:hypothetical protein
VAPVKCRVSLRVDPARLRVLQAISVRTGAPLAELMRRAIGEYLERHATSEELQLVGPGGNQQEGER